MKNFNFNKIIEYIKRNPKQIIIISISILLFILAITTICIFTNIEEHQEWEIYTGENLSEKKYPGYKNLIDSLSQEHPNWTFTLFYTRLDWNDVITNEGHSDSRTNPLNLIPDSSKYPNDWKCEIDKDKTFDNGTWLCASNKAISYAMDPRNILNNEEIFQFLELKYVENAQTISGIESITKDTFLEGYNISKALIEAGKNANLDPYFLASRLIQEQGRKGTTLSKGYDYNGTTIYNPFNINASGNSSAEILENAARYAYEHEWTSLDKALIEGVNFVKTAYIDKKQNTLYLQKFDVVDLDGNLYTNQYMQNLLAPTSEASNMLDIYNYSNTTDYGLNFIIPLYENMPEEISSY